MQLPDWFYPHSVFIIPKLKIKTANIQRFFYFCATNTYLKCLKLRIHNLKT